MIGNFFENRKAKKEAKSADKRDERMDNLEDSLAVRRDAAKRSEDQRLRKSDLEFRKEYFDKDKLKIEISEAKKGLYEIQDEIVRVITLSSSEIVYIDSMKDTPASKIKREKLDNKLKNALYSLTLVEQVLDRLDDLESEYEWKQLIRGLSNGYKVANAMSTGSDWFTRVMLRIRKFRFKDGAAPVETSNYHGKKVGEVIEESQSDDIFLSPEEKKKIVTDMLVSANPAEISVMEAVDIIDSAREGVFVKLTQEQLEENFKQEENKIYKEEGKSDEQGYFEDSYDDSLSADKIINRIKDGYGGI